jgi:hypothetical protein
METLLMVGAALALTGVFLSGAAESLSRPNVTVRETDEIVNNAVFEVAKALVVEAGL